MDDAPDAARREDGREQPAWLSRVRSPQDFAAGLLLIAIAAFALYASADLEAGRLAAIGPGMLPRSVAIIVGLFGVVIAAGSFTADGPRLERWSFRGPFFVLGAVLVFAGTIRGLWIDALGARIAIAVLAGTAAWFLAPRVLPGLAGSGQAVGRTLVAIAAAGLAIVLATSIVPPGLSWQVPIPGGLMVAGPLVVLISGFAEPELRWRELIIFMLIMNAFCIGLFRYALNLPIPLLILPGGYQI